MLEIDGGEGGGQVLRTALGLSMITGTAVRLTDVRGSRSTPGLRPQHLASVRVAAEVSAAAVEGAAVGETELTFRPGTVTGGSYERDVGTAGSVPLVFDTLVPLATTLDEPLELTATGGTDVKWSPSTAYYRRVKLPLLSQYGLDADVTLHRSGFYPAGGGRATLRVAPSTPSAFDLTDRDGLHAVSVYSKASESLEESDVARRQATAAADRLDELDVPHDIADVSSVPSTSPGSALLLRATYGGSLVGFDALGERGTSSEAVAEAATTAFETFRTTTAAVDEHLADQLLVFLALGGGQVRIPRITGHVRTNFDVIRAFGFELALDESSGGTAVVSAPGTIT